MLRWGRPSRLVEMVGYLLKAGPSEVALEDVNDDGCLLGMGLKAALVITRAGTSRVGVGLTP